MKNALLVLAACVVMGVAADSVSAQCNGGGRYYSGYHGGYHGGGGYYARPVYAAPVYAAPVYRSSYYRSVPAYGGYRSFYGGGYGSYGRGGYYGGNRNFVSIGFGF